MKKKLIQSANTKLIFIEIVFRKSSRHSISIETFPHYGSNDFEKSEKKDTPQCTLSKARIGISLL